jgi:ABC-type Zn uptake system ZnuABC Zn-binding protein ZnuA
VDALHSVTHDISSRPRELEASGNRAARVSVFVALLLASLGACAPHSPRNQRPMVAASIHPLGSLAQEIAGPDADVLVLLSPGASPHNFEPTPKAVADGSRASLVVRVGAGLDDWALPIVREALQRGAPEIMASTLIDSLLPATHHDPDEEEAVSKEATVDPHVWLDPPAMIPICQKLGHELSRLDPAHAEGYERRAAACADSLRALDRQLRDILGPVRGVPFVATHNAWGYLCRRYGLREAEVLQQIPTREPGPKAMVNLLRGAAGVGAKAIFTEVQLSDASAKTMARELDLSVVMLDPQGTTADRRRDRYYDLLRWNAWRMTAALSAPAAIELPPPGGSQP